MGAGPEAIRVEAWNVGKSKGKKNKDDEDDEPGCWMKLRFFGGCISSRPKADSSSSGASTQYAESKSTNDTSRDQPVVPIESSSTTSNAGSIPATPNPVEELKVASQLRKFCFNELKSATRNFRPESLLGEGGFGCVFKGWINENGTAPVKPGTGLAVAVKTLNHDGLQGHKEWLAEVNYLGELLHSNLVKLIGYCIEDNQRLLVYEFMPRGSLENHLFRRHLTSKSDVYSFGVVLLEMLTGRRSMDKRRPNGEHNLVEWARPYLGERRWFYRLIDPRLEGRFSIKGAQKAIQLAAQCLNRDPKARPLMSEIVEILKLLPNLKDMACSSTYFQAIQPERFGSNLNTGNGSRLQPGIPARHGQPVRSISIPSGQNASPYHHNHLHRSPKPFVGQPGH
ncbi:hypothetical protein HS088_TW04G00970 [Tripterygium wilfordii]|uniref:non-specific serine/threonine protein kinase n=1 Tax=Tripterygium wilfordii TaxID=458696 RepID=A0A7J7DRU8_TRIWF|nr:hypothetical protein HS088_TW04G00970 [Tripterygium wilfordii]